MAGRRSRGHGRGAGPGRGRLRWFASGGRYDKAVPTGRMACALEAAAPGGRVPIDAADDEVTVMMACWQAVGAHAEARMLAMAREIIRRRPVPACDGRIPAVPDYPISLPAQWDIGVAHEVAAELRLSWQAAEPLLTLAWELEARLPGVGSLLDDGVISPLAARIIVRELTAITDEARLAAAQRLLLQEDLGGDGMTPGTIGKLCQYIVDTVDPDGSARRREQAERDEARVRFFRTHGGAGAMFAGGLPADDALMSEANLQQRALAYEAAGIDEKRDLLRVLALLDSINGRGIDERLAMYRTTQAAGQATGPDPAEPTTASPGTGDDRSPGNGNGSGVGGSSGRGGPGGSGGNGTGRGSGGEGIRGGGGTGGPPAGTGRPDPGLPSLINLTLPLADLLDPHAQRPGEAPGYGSLDPGLVRKLAAAAINSTRSEFCLTLTDQHGHAAAHGCARLIRDNRRDTRNPRPGNGKGPGKGSGPPGAVRDGPPSGWALTRDTTPGPSGGHGTWTLTLPGGRRYRLDMHAIPLHTCDHRYATSAYRPTSLLRHLVQIRDGECTFTGCFRPARQSDFEHAVPYDKGGPTDACNAGARSRRCHRVKQGPGWTLTQPEPGWHRWTTPSGRSYTKGPKRYPA
ncbi:MAG TPA: DUF222 domain-containing protein [Trebonia sp.]